MISDTSPHPWVEGDRTTRDAAKVVSESTDHILMADVNATRTQAKWQAKDALDMKPQPDYLVMAALSGDGLDAKLNKVGAEALKYYNSQDPSIFAVRSGRFAGMEVPPALRCATFQSNIAVRAGLISPAEVTVRAIEFGNLMERKGYHKEKFDARKNYPSGTYIVGEGGGSDGEKNHVGMVLNGNLIHTHAGKINYEPVSNKFRPGAYDQMRVYIPPHRKSI